MNRPLFEASNIHKSYGRGAARFDALDSVSLSVQAGESVAIVGKSGSGKSTLMHLLALLDTPDSGTLRVGGSDATSLSATQIGRIRNQDFGFEAIFIGFLGSIIGTAVAIATGSIVSAVLADSILADLEGLQVMQFAPGPVAAIILLVMFIAFLSGTLPARRASRQNPIDALRYE